MELPPMQKSLSHKNETESVERKILTWMASGHTGMSSEAMAYCAANVEPRYKSTPSDPSDFIRCLKLVREVPEIRDHFPKIAKLTPEWLAFIANWDRIEKSLINETGFDFDKRSSAPITYQLMKDLRAKR